MFKRDRKVYLRNLCRNRGIVRLEAKDPDIQLNRYLTYSIEMNDFMFASGIIPIKIHNLWSYSGFDLRVGVKTDFRYRRVLEPINNTHLNTNDPNSPNYKPNPAGSASDRRRILTDENSHTQHVGSAWVTLFDFSGISTFLGFVLRAVIILIQFFLVIVRPIMAKKGSNFYDWSISFVSTMFSLQLILLFGLLAENFGGPMNSSLEELLLMSRKRFFDRFQSTIIAKLDDEFEGAGYWKLIEAKYIANPLYDNYVGIFFLVFGIFACVCCTVKGSGGNSVAKKIRIGASLAFMMPLMVNSVNCLYAVFQGGIYTMGALFGMGASLMILAYYMFFGFEIMGNHKKSNYYKSSYNHINFDWPLWWAKAHIKNYEFFIHWALITVMVLTANMPKIPLPFATFLFAVNFLCIGITPTRRFKMSQHKLIHKIKILKLIDAFLKTMFFGIMSFYVFWRRTIGSMGVKLFTVVGMILLYIIVGINWGIFICRLVGLCGRGEEATMGINNQVYPEEELHGD